MSSWRETAELLGVGLENAAWLAWRTGCECLRYGHRRWWWQLRCALRWGWLDSSPLTLIREAKLGEKREEELVYGETLPGTAYELLRRLELQPSDLVVDLGCGRGVVPLVASRALGVRAHGIDLLSGYIERCQRLARWLQVEELCTFEQGDLLKCAIPEAQVYFFAGTCLGAKTWNKVVRRLSQAAPQGAWAISLSQALPSEQWEPLDEEKWPFSWGKATVYLARRK